MKNPMIKHLVLIALSASLAVFVIPAITGGFGSVSISMDLYRYYHCRTTLYRGIRSSMICDTQVVGMTAQSSGTVVYKTHTRMSGPGLENPVNITDTSPFTISIGGSEADVPFEFRNQFCSWPTFGLNGSPEVVQTTTKSEAVYQIIHRYTTNPWFKSKTTDVSINTLNWQKERQGCEEVRGTMSYSFNRTITNNATTYTGIGSPDIVNMRHDVGSGIGLTW